MIINVGLQTHGFVMHNREHVQFEKTCYQKHATKTTNLSRNHNGTPEDRIGANKFPSLTNRWWILSVGTRGLFKFRCHTCWCLKFESSFCEWWFSLQTFVRVQQSLSVDGVLKVVETVTLCNVQKGDREYTHAQIQMPHVLVSKIRIVILWMVI